MQPSLKIGRSAFRWPLFASLVVLLALAVAAVWALALPMFQEQDESNHYDYALTLFSARRPIWPTEGNQQSDTHPTLRYLMRETNARALRLDDELRVPSGYGSLTFFASIDRKAPLIDLNRFGSGPIQPVPYISKLYPLPYYALAAGAIAIGNVIGRGSIVAQFFAARLFSVALLGVALTFTWLNLRELDVKEPRALGLFACVALFPLTSWVSGYVQPDNLVFALISIVVFLALRVRRNSGDAGLLILLGLTLGALFATKRHFALAVALPVYGLVAVRIKRFRWHSIAFIITALAMPSLMALVLTEPFLHAPAGLPQLCPPGADNLRMSFAHGLPAGLLALGTGANEAAVSTFLGGRAMWYFWLGFGAYFTPITIGNSGLTTVIAAVIQAAVIIVTLLLIYAIVRNSIRLYRVAGKRSWKTAARVATANVLVNSYFVYLSMLIAFEAVTRAAITIQGRYWLPFLPAIWFLAIQVAPRALPKRFKSAVTKVLLASLLLFATVASPSALISMYLRFYSPVQPANKTAEIFGAFSSSAGGSTQDVNLGSVAPGTTLFLTGSAVDRRNADAAAESSLAEESNNIVLGTTPASDQRLACLNGDSNMVSAGFKATIQTERLHTGVHTFSLFIRPAWSPTFIDSGARATFTILPDQPL